MEHLRINDHRNYTISDNDVVKRVLGGEKELYEILLRRHNQVLYRVLRGYLNDEDSIKDLMQDTYLKAYEKLYQFKFESAFSTWLIRIGINEALKKIQSNNKLKAVTADTLKVYQPDDQISSIPNPEKQMIQNESTRILEQAISELDMKYRVVYIMKEVEEMSIKSIAEILDISESNVKVRIHRSRAMIKDGLYQISKKEDAFEFGFKRCDAIVERVMQKIL